MSDRKAHMCDRHRANGSGIFVLLFWLVVAHAAAATDDGLILPAHSMHSEQLAPGQSLSYRIALAAGQSAELSVQQIESTLQLSAVRQGDADPLLLQTDAGREARLHFTLIAAAATTWRIQLAPRKKNSAAQFRIELGPAHATTAADRARATSQQLFAQAEVLRRAADAATRTAARTAYRNAVVQAQNAGDGCGLRMIFTGSARFEAAAGDYAAALAAARHALQQGCAADFAEQAQAHKSLGLALGYLGDFAAAASADERALALYRQTGDRYFQGVLLGNISAVYRELGQTQKALDAAGAALQLAQALDDRQGVIFTRESIAAIRLSRGELALALAQYRRTLEDIASTPYPMIEGQAWNDLGIVYRRLGDAAQSLDAYARARAIWQQTDNRNGLAETLLNQGEALQAQDRSAAASEVFAQAFELAQDGGFRSEQAHALRGLGRVALRAGHLEEAQTKIEASRVLTHDIGEIGGEAYAEHALGDLAIARADNSAAHDHFRRALTLAQRADDSAEQAEAWAAIARIEAAANQLIPAHDAIDHALDIVENQRARIDDGALRTGYFAVQRAYYELCIDVLMRLDSAEPGRGHAVAALEISERARARSLQDLLAERAIDIQRDLDPALLVDERSAEENLHRLAWREAQFPAAASARERDELKTELDAATRRLDQVRGRIRAANPRYANLVRPARPNLATMQRELLSADSVVLEYWLGDRRSYVWRITRDAVQTHVLPPRVQIESQVAVLRERILARGADAAAPLDKLAAHDAAEATAIMQLARELGTQLHISDPAAPARQNSVVIADGALLTLPFNLLADRSENTAQALVQDTVFVYLPSLGALSALRALPRAAAPRKKVAIVADPVFRADDPRLPPAAHESSSAALPGDVAPKSIARAVDIAALPRLANARHEAETIAALAGADAASLTLGFAASREAVVATRWSDYAVVHFATHAVLDLAQPALSGIVLSLYDDQAQARDGFLRVSDLYNLRMPVDLVVLSVCDAAVGKEIGSEGAFSLARGFFYAGTRRVIASLWTVDDRASAQFMAYFYRAYLQDHVSPQAALAQAQRQMRNDARWAAPFYWAGFVLQGDWR